MAEVAEGPVPLLRRGLQHQGGERRLRTGDGQSTVHRAAVHRADLYKPGPIAGLRGKIVHVVSCSRCDWAWCLTAWSDWPRTFTAALRRVPTNGLPAVPWLLG
jgi:hypothetical protein